MPKVSDDRLAARRREILDGARHCFAEYGYDGATVKRIEESTGLSRGAIFHHFRDKEALFLALAREDAERMADVAAEQGLVQVMRDVLARPQDFDWLGTRLEIARKLRTDSSFRDAWLAHSAEVDRATLDRLERGRRTGRLRDDVPTEVLLDYLDLVLDGLITRLASGRPTDDLSAVLDLVEESVRTTHSPGASSAATGSA
ncbi:TetR/AcrR family transcriptional regulator [Gordonia sinesedis]